MWKQAKIVNFANYMEGLVEYKTGMDLTVKTFAGLEDLLAEELIKLGAENVEKIKRGCTLRGEKELIYKINYLSRLAIRVLKPIGVFEVKDEDQLYEKVKKINWLNVFNVGQTFQVDANLFHSELTHSQYVVQRTKDAIVDQFRDQTGKRPWVNTDNPDIYIDVHISQNICTISLDSSGESLHKRGYKVAADKAPINEVLAAGLIALSGWDGKTDLYDPMCGSCTIPIEAAMKAMDIPAGYYRKEFAFMNWEDFDNELWDTIKSDSDLLMKDLECNIYASDRSDKAIGIAKRNLKNSGLHKDIKVEVAFFDSIEPKSEKGVIIMNPPYGMRLEERGELRDLYRGIGDVLKNSFSGFQAWIISPNFETVKFVGLRPSERITLYNGPVESKFFKFEVYSGTRRYGNTEKKEWKDTRKDMSGRRDRLKNKFAKPVKKSSDNFQDRKTTKPDYEKKDTIDSPRENLKKRSKDFERKMESLRKFTRSDKNDTPKKRRRKRISDDDDKE